MVKRRARVHGRRLSLRSDGYGLSGGRFVCHEVSSDRRRHVEGHTLIRLVWVLRSAGWAEWLSRGEEWFDSFVSENEERGHRPQTVRERLAARMVW
jgi:hypothetical protein